MCQVNTNMEIMCMDPMTLPCADCGLLTGRFCDGGELDRRDHRIHRFHVSLVDGVSQAHDRGPLDRFLLSWAVALPALEDCFQRSEISVIQRVAQGRHVSLVTPQGPQGL